MGAGAVTWEQLCELAGALPGVTVEPWYGTPALKVGGKGFVRLKEDGATVVFVVDSVDTQEALIEAMPAIYFLTDHYKGYPAVLARLAKLPRAEARDRIDHAWRQKASRALREAWDRSGAHGAEPAGTAAAPRKAPRWRKATAGSRPGGPGRRARSSASPPTHRTCPRSAVRRST